MDLFGRNRLIRPWEGGGRNPKGILGLHRLLPPALLERALLGRGVAGAEVKGAHRLGQVLWVQHGEGQRSGIPTGLEEVCRDPADVCMASSEVNPCILNFGASTGELGLLFSRLAWSKTVQGDTKGATAEG